MDCLIVFSHLRWNFVYQRAQHLKSRVAACWPVIFVEEPLTAQPADRLERLQPAPGVHVWRPHAWSTTAWTNSRCSATHRGNWCSARTCCCARLTSSSPAGPACTTSRSTGMPRCTAFPAAWTPGTSGRRPRTIRCRPGWDVPAWAIAISPTKMLEYMACGRPSVSTSIRDVVEPCGHVVSIVDGPDADVAACEAILARDAATRRAHADELAFAIALTSWDRTAQRMAALIAQVDAARHMADEPAQALAKVA